MQCIRLLTEIQSTAKYYEDFNKNNYQENNGSISSRPAIGCVADYDLINDDRDSLVRGYELTSKAAFNNSKTKKKSCDILFISMKVRALYSYIASESDETHFADGDTVIECEHIDAD
ncbi:unnamed protein product [Rotaria sp. Silwood1]|nr:unnamed protein product [Rotaria sp. Silwood1]